MRAYLASSLALAASRASPDAPAVSLGARTLTYGALEALSNRVARALRRRGVRRGDRVAILLDKSPFAVACLIGIMKADAVCAPLDPLGPPGRLARILDDCGAALVVASPARRAKLDAALAETPAGGPETLIVEAFAGDDDASEGAQGWRALLAEGDAPLAQAATDADLAYLLYTSGSMGAPKGVMITHRNIVAFVDWASGWFDVGPTDRVACHAPLQFDLTLFDLYVALAAGAEVRLAPHEIGMTGADLVDFIAREEITVWQSVPSALKLIGARLAAAQASLPSLRIVAFAGEPYPAPALRALMERLPQARFHHIYGSTEMNDVACKALDGPPEGDAAPIGKACANAELFALDDDGRLVTSPGTVGELYARAPTVAAGYWGDPAMTAARFVQNPLHDAFRDIVYRTGDLAVFDADGDWFYRGRRDGQVKIRGNRVNLAEVEAAAARHPAVAEAVVVAPEDAAGERRLRLYVVARPGATVDPRELRRFCLGALPAYMAPEAVETRAALPRTATGKIDRKALADQG